MLSPRETTYKRQCTDTQDFLKTKMLEGREDILAMCDGEEAKELLKSPRERIKEMEKSPKRAGSVRSLVTRAHADCRAHGERLRHILLHATQEDGPTEMHRCDAGIGPASYV